MTATAWVLLLVLGWLAAHALAVALLTAAKRGDQLTEQLRDIDGGPEPLTRSNYRFFERVDDNGRLVRWWHRRRT